MANFKIRGVFGFGGIWVSAPDADSPNEWGQWRATAWGHDNSITMTPTGVWDTPQEAAEAALREAHFEVEEIDVFRA